MRVWVTRAAAGAEATAERLRAAGHEPLVAPLVAVEPLRATPPHPADVAALAFTSATGVRAFAELVPEGEASRAWRAKRVFAVGGATATAARAAGWADVEDADGDGEALARRLAHARVSGPVLAPGARAPAFDLPAAARVARMQVLALPVYATAPVSPPPPEPLLALGRGEVDAVLLQSASAARALDTAVPEAPAGVLAACLSAACRPAAPGWRIRVAQAPREADLLRLLAAPEPLDSPALRR